jgi:RNA polymerase sigma factor (sigma-70 family)
MTELDREEFTRCWHAHAGQIRAYASRHVGHEDARDVAAETFLQAWRRWPEVPETALPWLIGTARKVIGNRRRSDRRRDALAVRVALLDDAAKNSSGVDLVAETRQAAVEALAALTEADREALLLVAWDGLSPDEAAKALGVKAGTLRVRLHRARARLTALSATIDTEEYSWPTT